MPLFTVNQAHVFLYSSIFKVIIGQLKINPGQF